MDPTIRQLAKWGCLAAVLVAAPAVRADLEQQPAQREMEERERELQKQARQPRLTKPPKLIHEVQPVYPETAKAEKRQGVVIIRITIDDEGYVQRMDVIQSAGADLDWAAMGAIGQYVFEPAEVDDVPAPIQIDYRQNFVLQEEVKEVAVAPPIEEGEDAIPPPEQPPPVAEEGAEPLKPVNFYGRVRESGTKAPLMDIEVAVVVDPDEEPLSAVTDRDGRFEIRGVPAGEHLVRISGTGYEQSTSIEAFSEKEAVRAIYYLPRKSYNKFETVVTARRAQKEVSRIALSRAEVSSVPGTFGDPIRVIENLPGMARAPLLGGALIVRGANPQDTGVYIDGVPIPLLYHFLALTSVVNSEFLESIDFYPGGFGARYGRATAGIVDVKTRDLKLRSCRGSAKVDIIDSAFFFGCPVTLWGPEVDSDAPSLRRITFAGAGRRSYLDAVLPLALELLLPAGSSALTAAPVYWDFQAKAEYRPFAAHTFSLFTFGSDDKLKVIAGGTADTLGAQINTHQGFTRMVAAWEWRPTPRVTNRLSPWLGVENNSFNGSSGAIALDFTIDIRSWGIRDDFTYTLMDGLNLNAGVDVVGGLYDLAGEFPLSTEIGAFPRIIPRLTGPPIIFKEGGNAQLWGGYVEAEMGPWRGLKIVSGFRFDLFDFEKAYKFAASPRLAVRYEVFPGTTLKGAYGVYEKLPDYQTLSSELGNRELGNERSRHHVVGVEHKLTPFLNVELQLFYNRKSELAVLSDRILDIDQGRVVLENYSNDGRGSAYGAELMLRHELTKNFYGWIAYTLMRSDVQLKYDLPLRVYEFDQTHILTLVGQYKLPWHLPFREWSRLGRLPRGVFWNTGWAILSGDWSVGGRFRLVTGNPTTPYASAAHDLDTNQFIPKSGALYSARIPAFHQLDVRVDYKMAFDSFLVNLYVDLINFYNRKNPETLVWDFRYRESAPLALLPFLPVLGLSAEF
ncbi:MAG: TonB-dependent receptor [Deltaproteobacteria bacterium]|nr:TonB-dependent receptor [Deltaproteobacteria bacterium]